MKKRFSLRTRLFLYITLILTTLCITSLTTYTSAYRYIDSFRLNLKTHHRINAFLLLLREDYRELGNILKSGSESAPDDLKKRHTELESTMNHISEESNTSLNAWFQINALGNALAVYREKSLQAVGEFAEGKKDYFQAYYTAERIYKYMETYISDLQNIRLSEGWIYYSRLSEQAELARRLLIVIIAAISFLSFLFAANFSRSFTHPIHHLAELSRRMANGELDIPRLSTNHGEDEITVLTESFNMMSTNIRALVENLESKSALEKKLHEEELEKESTLRSLREAQLINLETQIKPHFFFNALNTIVRQAQLEKAEETAALIQSLANIFRHNLVSHQKSIPLEQELRAVSEYLSLQRRRFGDRIRFEVRNRAEGRTLLVPPLIIQPFAENSVCHGLEPLVRGGKLLVDIQTRGERLFIRIADNGTGMDREKLRALREGKGVEMEGSTEGIGIRNVIARLALYYGGAERFRMYSIRGRGTLTVIELPFEGAK